MRNNDALMMFVLGLGTGAALMYFLDPDRGRRRRALVRDQAVSFTNDAREAINATTEDLSNRAYGLYAETRKAVGSPLPHNRDQQTETNQTNFETNQTNLDTEIGRSATSR
jgi:gas vesicle protein